MYFRIINDDTILDYSDSKYDDACLFSDLCTKAEYEEHPNKYMIGDIEQEIDVPDYEEVEEEYIDPETGEKKTRTVLKPVMIDKEETIIVIDYDEEGNPIGEHEETIIVQVPSTHKETITVKGIVLNPDFEEEEAEKEAERIGNLQITKRVFMLGLQQLGVTYAQLKQLIATNEQAQMEWDLCVELQRKNPLLDIMAAQLSVSPAMLDYIFQKANGEDVQPPANEE